MNKLEDVDPEVLRTALADATEPKAVKRLMVALSYLDGASADALSERFGIPRSTIYYWLDRFESRSAADAASDDDRPGRPPRLSADQREVAADALASPPHEYGYDAGSWTADLFRTFLAEEFGVDYSEGHARRLLDALGTEIPDEI